MLKPNFGKVVRKVEILSAGPTNNLIKVPLSGLIQFLKTESLLKTMKNTFYFMLKALFILKIFTILFWLFGHVGKRVDEKVKVDLKLYDIIDWRTSQCNTHSDQYFRKQKQPHSEIRIVNRKHDKYLKKHLFKYIFVNSYLNIQ